MYKCGQIRTIGELTHSCTQSPGHIDDHRCNGVCNYTWPNTGENNIGYCDEKSYNEKDPGVACRCRLDKEHPGLPHKCICGHKWGYEDTKSTYSNEPSVKIFLYALVRLMDADLTLGQAIHIANQEIDRLDLHSSTVTLANADLIIKAIGDRLGYEFDIPANMLQ